MVVVGTLLSLTNTVTDTRTAVLVMLGDGVPETAVGDRAVGFATRVGVSAEDAETPEFESNGQLFTNPTAFK
jgi:hypothetical protein